MIAFCPGVQNSIKWFCKSVQSSGPIWSIVLPQPWDNFLSRNTNPRGIPKQDIHAKLSNHAQELMGPINPTKVLGHPSCTTHHQTRALCGRFETPYQDAFTIREILFCTLPEETRCACAKNGRGSLLTLTYFRGQTRDPPLLFLNYCHDQTVGRVTVVEGLRLDLGLESWPLYGQTGMLFWFVSWL